eukprot:13233852-Alexandrium_andersonii.AAC.1
MCIRDSAVVDSVLARPSARLAPARAPAVARAPGRAAGAAQIAPARRAKGGDFRILHMRNHAVQVEDVGADWPVGNAIFAAEGIEADGTGLPNLGF